jgi:2-dehydropantoate 2-reductase
MNKVLIIGHGNIGTFVGATLKANEDINHLIRQNIPHPKEVILNFSDRRSKKFRIAKGTKYPYQVTDNVEDISVYDFIVIPVAHYHFRNVIKKINPYLTPKQVVVLMGNMWNDFEWLDSNIQNPYIFVFPNFGGALINNKLQGWLTPNFTTGTTKSGNQKSLELFNDILLKSGFKPQVENDIKGWLITHFAYNAGMLLEAAKQDGFQKMTKKISSLSNMYATMQECMSVASKTGIDITRFKEGRAVYQAKWWNALKTYFMFLVPGLAKNADATKNIEDWTSYSKEIWKTGNQISVSTPILNAYYNKKNK